LKLGFLVDEADGRRVAVGQSLVVGRTRDCGFVIDDSAASRRHFEITPRNDIFVWKDLGSTNGTVVNGARMLAGELRHGDRIQVGETAMLFQVESDGADSTAGRGDQRIFTETIMDRSGHVQPPRERDKSAKLLETVYSVVNEISTNYEPCSLVDRILELTVRAINAQRGAIFLRGNDNELMPCPVCNQVHTFRDGRLRPLEQDEIRISQTVAMRVLGGCESVLYQDSDLDAEMNASESIMSLDLRSILCVPLRSKEGVLGILYVDTDRQDQQYSQDDLLLAAAVGNSAGLALENANMHQELLEKQRIEQEIETAWTIQEGFLIKDWPARDRRFQVCGETRPAKTVGGDFYDFVQPQPDVVGILVGDVSGKGVPAALTMAQLLAQFRLHARDLESPREVLQRLNVELSERTRRGLFCSACYVTVNLRTGAVLSANAGHPPALAIGAQGAEQFSEATGPPLGIVAEATWEDHRAVLCAGDSILLYSDGIIEARSMVTRHDANAGSAFGEYEVEGLQRFASAQYGRSPRLLLDGVLQDVQRFCAPGQPHDDCTLISLRWLGDV